MKTQSLSIVLGHYMYTSFSSATFSKVHAGGRPLPFVPFIFVDHNKSSAPGLERPSATPATEARNVG